MTVNNQQGWPQERNQEADHQGNKWICWTYVKTFDGYKSLKPRSLPKSVYGWQRNKLVENRAKVK